MCSHVTRVQITDSARTLSKVRLSDFCDVFLCSLLTSNNVISLAIWCDRHLKIFQTNISLDLRARSILLSEKFPCTSFTNNQIVLETILSSILQNRKVNHVWCVVCGVCDIMRLNLCNLDRNQLFYSLI